MSEVSYHELGRMVGAEVGEKLYAFEIKWSEKTRARFPQTFTINYPEAATGVVHPGSMETYLMAAE